MLFRKANKSLMVTAAMLLLGLTVHEQAGAFELLTAKEIAVLSQQAEGYTERGTSNPDQEGPRIDIKSPNLSNPVSNPFDIEIAFSPQGDAVVDPNTLSIECSKFFLVGYSPYSDITERVLKSGKAKINLHGVKASGAQVEQGKYKLKISVRDNKNRVGIAMINFDVP